MRQEGEAWPWLVVNLIALIKTQATIKKFLAAMGLPTLPPAAAWRAKGQDESSIVADPQFVSPDSLDFRMTQDTAAKRIGLHPFDTKSAGRTTELTLTVGLPPVPPSVTAVGNDAARPKLSAP